MIYIDTKFSGRVIICGLNETNVKSFTKELITNIWLEHSIPDGMRKVGSGNKLTLEMLPPNYDIEAVSNRAVDKGILMIERIGSVNIWLNMFIVRSQGTDHQIKIDIDKYKYEKDGANLSAVVNKTIKNYEVR